MLLFSLFHCISPPEPFNLRESIGNFLLPKSYLVIQILVGNVMFVLNDIRVNSENLVEGMKWFLIFYQDLDKFHFLCQVLAFSSLDCLVNLIILWNLNLSDLLSFMNSSLSRNKSTTDRVSSVSRAAEKIGNIAFTN